VQPYGMKFRKGIEEQILVFKFDDNNRVVEDITMRDRGTEYK
jgi:hypothetical protein